MRKARISAPCAGARFSSFTFAALFLAPTSGWAQEGAPPTRTEDAVEQVPTNPSTQDSPELEATDEAAASDDSDPGIEPTAAEQAQVDAEGETPPTPPQEATPTQTDPAGPAPTQS